MTEALSVLVVAREPGDYLEVLRARHPELRVAVCGGKRKLAELFCDNVSRYLAGSKLLNRVSPERSY